MLIGSFGSSYYKNSSQSPRDEDMGGNQSTLVNPNSSLIFGDIGESSNKIKEQEDIGFDASEERQTKMGEGLIESEPIQAGGSIISSVLQNEAEDKTSDVEL